MAIIAICLSNKRMIRKFKVLDNILPSQFTQEVHLNILQK